ncbi:nicotinamide riboside kinase 1 [Gadus macrocephalus]|uniref:nicotinamide riboside kinase 1 n=1 Tax=Gadus macrocephalus TaxID=80720 RepID=UPI0024C232C5|nr:nicotinamide riboside kinase 1 isoform X1 [Gadus chalcogrammus]XP_059910519.1 nicotinamide riboside kinase 1 [Gadus macrocephalus]
MNTLTLVVGIGGVTNGGKSTLATNLQKKLPHSCIIAQDTFFKDDSVVPVDSNGFKQYDLLDALHMDKMMEEIYSWWRDPQSYHQSTCATTEAGRTEVFVVIVEGFLIFNHRPLNELMNKKYFLEIPYDECQNRRCSRVYTPPDPPGYFDGHVWPMYLKNRQEMQLQGIVFLDGLKSEAELLGYVYDDITTEIKNLRGKTEINSVNL